MNSSDKNEQGKGTKDSGQPIEKMSFEGALSELETIVSNLERGDTALEESIRLYERGALLKIHCENRLASAQMRIDKVILKEGEVKLENMETSEKKER